MNFSIYSDYLKSLIDQGIPACEAIIMKNHEVLYHEVMGFSDSNKEKKATDSDLYFLYSSSKVLTCAATMKLMEEYPEITLDTPVYEALPEWKSPLVKENGALRPAKRDIKLIDLMTMSAGVTYNTYTNNIRACIAENPNATARDLSVAIAKDNLVFDPGESVLYSLCHDLLFAFIESVTGKRASEYVKSRIAEPLGMKDFYYHKEGIENRLSEQYFMRKVGLIEKIGKVNEYVFTPSYDSGGAGVITTCSEYVKFLDALANFGVGANGERILSRASVEEMKKNRLDEKRLYDFYQKGNGMGCYGYGLGVQTLITNYDKNSGNRSLSNIGEFGWGGAAGANMTIDTELGLTVFFVRHVLNTPVPKGFGANHNDNYRFKLRDLAYLGLNS